MKKLLMSAIVLSVFALAISLAQVSCSKSQAQQNTPTDNPQLSKIIFVKGYSTSTQLWTANYDGSNATQIPLTLPSNVTFDNNVTTFSLSISPDGQTVFFTGYETTGGTSVLNIYSCDISGNNLRVVVSGATGAPHHAVAY